MVQFSPLRLSHNAMDTIRAVHLTNEEVLNDVAEVRAGMKSRATLLEECLKGAEGEDVIKGWTEYVDAVCAYTGEENEGGTDG